MENACLHYARNSSVKVSWEIPIFIDHAPADGENRLDMSIMDKEKRY